jgi:hypothetical protein
MALVSEKSAKIHDLNMQVSAWNRFFLERQKSRYEKWASTRARTLARKVVRSLDTQVI